tara:strand:- start:373 stop:690 length:318 start_codon:yes stop_codon:yes gene_type:complete
MGCSTKKGGARKGKPKGSRLAYDDLDKERPKKGVKYPKKVWASKKGKRFPKSDLSGRDTRKTKAGQNLMKYRVEFKDGIPVIRRGGKWLRIDKYLIAWMSADLWD